MWNDEESLIDLMEGATLLSIKERIQQLADNYAACFRNTGCDFAVPDSCSNFERQYNSIVEAFLIQLASGCLDPDQARAIANSLIDLRCAPSAK